MGQLRCVFDVVRLVDPEKMQVLEMVCSIR